MCWIRRRLKGLFFIRLFYFGKESVMGLLMENGRMRNERRKPDYRI